MKIGIAGCGYVAHLYLKTLANHPGLQLAACCDPDPGHLANFRRAFAVPGHGSCAEMLAQSDVELVLNLTNPRSHLEVTRACLAAGKHVYSEKPLALTYGEALALAEQAERAGLQLASAPSSVLGESAQTLWAALRRGVIGRPKLVYANFDEGLLIKDRPWQQWPESGLPWPARDEFETGCTYEHAGYALSWLAAFFGPARRVTAFATCLDSDKGVAVTAMAPDFSVACIEYGDGVVARLTCSLVGPKDRSLTIVGDEGTLSVGDVRDETAPVYLSRTDAGLERRIGPARKWLERRFTKAFWPAVGWHARERLPLVRRPPALLVSKRKPVDFLRGPAELAAAVTERRASRLPARLGLHLTELTEAIQHSATRGAVHALQSTFASVEPLAPES